MILAGYSSRLSAFDSFEIIVSNNGSFNGEYYDNTAMEELAVHKGFQKGVYRLKVTSNIPGTQAATDTVCIPYNATAQQLTDILNSIPAIKVRGGATIRRYGDQNNPRYSFGYTYRIQMDAPPSNLMTYGPLGISFSCYGQSCNCAQTKVPLLDFQNNTECVRYNNFSRVDPHSCILPPIITSTRISSLSYLLTSGLGTISLYGGIHRLPYISSVTIATDFIAIGIVSADSIDWIGFSCRGNSKLIIAGTGWLGWDSSYLLYSPDWVYRRGFSTALDIAPSFTMKSSNFYISEFGNVLSSCPLNE